MGCDGSIYITESAKAKNKGSFFPKKLIIKHLLAFLCTHSLSTSWVKGLKYLLINHGYLKANVITVK